jgi:hypothetical protein
MRLVLETLRLDGQSGSDSSDQRGPVDDWEASARRLMRRR